MTVSVALVALTLLLLLLTRRVKSVSVRLRPALALWACGSFVVETSGVEMDRIGVTLLAVVEGVNVADDELVFDCFDVANVGWARGTVTFTSMKDVFVVWIVDNVVAAFVDAAVEADVDVFVGILVAVVVVVGDVVVVVVFVVVLTVVVVVDLILILLTAGGWSVGVAGVVTEFDVNVGDVEDVVAVLVLVVVAIAEDDVDAAEEEEEDVVGSVDRG